jgi:hypothetical protein
MSRRSSSGLSQSAASLLTLALLEACVHTQSAPPPIASAALLNARLAAGRSTVRAYTAEVRLTYFGAKGRVRGTASLAVQRPASLRYEVMGPHGGVLVAFATNGQELQTLDLASSRFVYGPASRDNLDQLFSVAPLHLGAGEWVSLLFGEVGIPDGASVGSDASRGRLIAAWSEGQQTVRVEIDAKRNRVVRAVVQGAGGVLTEIDVRAWDDRGLPAVLQLRVPPTGDDVELKLRDVAYDPILEPQVFVLEPPRGAKLEHLEPVP